MSTYFRTNCLAVCDPNAGVLSSDDNPHWVDLYQLKSYAQHHELPTILVLAARANNILTANYMSRDTERVEDARLVRAAIGDERISQLPILVREIQDFYRGRIPQISENMLHAMLSATEFVTLNIFLNRRTR